MEINETSLANRFYPAIVINITNRCTLKCKHCFIYRDSNPNDPSREMNSEAMLAELKQIKQNHSVSIALWMGGEPLLRKDVLIRGTRMFSRNHVTTNGTLELIELPNTIYIISLDGPPALNDEIRGKGSFEKVMKTISRIPPAFSPTLMVQCVASRKNEDKLEDLIKILKDTNVKGMTFSFYVPRKNDDTDFTWGSLEARDKAVLKVLQLKEKYPDFIWNNRRSLELMFSQNAKQITDDCPAKKFVLPLYLEGDKFVSPFCCYGNDVDCDLCGAWVVFHIAAKLEKMERARGDSNSRPTDSKSGALSG